HYTSCHSSFLFFLIPPPPPRSTLFPYTTLFRSRTRKVIASGSLPTASFLMKLSLTMATLGAPARSCSSKSRPPRNGVCKVSKKRSEEHTSELQSLAYLVCRLLLEKKKKN